MKSLQQCILSLEVGPVHSPPESCNFRRHDKVVLPHGDTEDIKLLSAHILSEISVIWVEMVEKNELEPAASWMKRNLYTGAKQMFRKAPFI